MVEKPLVSVLMTVYNREKYIAEAINSVLASTYTNFELIIVDDKSKDNSVEIAEGFAQQDNRIRVYLNEKNIGDYSNRNKAASYAKGKYLKYVDADDMIYPYGLEQLVFYMEQFPEAGYGLCSMPNDKYKIFPFKLTPKQAYYYHYFKQGVFVRAPLSSIINREIFLKIGGFSGKQHVGDYELWHLFSLKYDVVLMPGGITWYREHDDQQMNDNRTDPKVPFKYLLLSEAFLNSPSCPMDIEKIRKSLNKIKLLKARSVLSAMKNNSLKLGFQLKQAGKVSIWDIVSSLLK